MQNKPKETKSAEGLKPDDIPNIKSARLPYHSSSSLGAEAELSFT